MSDGFDPADFIAGFIAEAEEHLTSANANLLSVEVPSAKGAADAPRQGAQGSVSLASHPQGGYWRRWWASSRSSMSRTRWKRCLRDADRAAGRLPPGSVEPLLAGIRVIEQGVRALAKKKQVPAASQTLAQYPFRSQTSCREARKGASSLVLSLPAELVGQAERRRAPAIGSRGWRLLNELWSCGSSRRRRGPAQASTSLPVRERGLAAVTRFEDRQGGAPIHPCHARCARRPGVRIRPSCSRRRRMRSSRRRLPPLWKSWLPLRWKLPLHPAEGPAATPAAS